MFYLQSRVSSPTCASHFVEALRWDTQAGPGALLSLPGQRCGNCELH